MIQLNINGKAHTVDVDPDTPLLWVLRDTLGMTGTKYGCGIARCGACTVHLNGQPVRSCGLPVSEAARVRIAELVKTSPESAPDVEMMLLFLEQTSPQRGIVR